MADPSQEQEGADIRTAHAEPCTSWVDRRDSRPHPWCCAGGTSSAGYKVVILAALINTLHALCAALEP